MKSTKTIKFGDDKFVLFISEKRIQKRVQQLGKKISKDYKGKTPIFICILNGAFVFMADLFRNVTVDCEVDFLKLSSYGDAKISSGKVHLIKDLNCQVEDRDIIIVEDIIDSGLSIKFMEEMIQHMNPRSVRVAALLYKPKSVKFDVTIDYIGFRIPNKFVIGYGLDYSQKVRNLRDIYRLAK